MGRKYSYKYMFRKKATKSWFENYKVNVKSTLIFLSKNFVAFLENLNCTQTTMSQIDQLQFSK